MRACTHPTGADFKAADVDRKRWLDGGWLRREDADGPRARYVRGPRFAEDGPLHGYEAEAEALRRLDAAAPNETAIAPVQS